MAIAVDEFYIIHTEIPTGGRRTAPASRTGFVSEDGLLSPFAAALRFPSLEQAERYLSRHGDPRYRFLIQRCSREAGTPARDDALHRLSQRVMEVPPPYRRTAYNWLRGKDIETILRRQGEGVYERHVAALADHDFDITRPSAVILMRPKRKRIAINTGGRSDGPRQFVALPSQRPSAAPVLDDTGEDE